VAKKSLDTIGVMGEIVHQAQLAIDERKYREARALIGSLATGLDELTKRILAMQARLDEKAAQA
jgi:hypothetical protein